LSERRLMSDSTSLLDISSDVCPDSGRPHSVPRNDDGATNSYTKENRALRL